MTEIFSFSILMGKPIKNSWNSLCNEKLCWLYGFIYGFLLLDISVDFSNRRLIMIIRLSEFQNWFDMFETAYQEATVFVHLTYIKTEQKVFFLWSLSLLIQKNRSWKHCPILILLFLLCLPSLGYWTLHKPFQCPQCEATFSRKQFLEIHSRTHSGGNI